MFITNNHPTFYLWWKENFLCLYEPLQLLKKTAIFWLEFTLSFQKNIKDQAWKSLDTKLGPYWKDWKRSYQVRQILSSFLQLSYSNFWSRLQSYQYYQRSQVWRGLGQVRSKKLLPKTTMDRTFETLIFSWNSALRENFNFYFSNLFAIIDKIYILTGRIGTRLSFYEDLRFFLCSLSC